MLIEVVGSFCVVQDTSNLSKLSVKEFCLMAIQLKFVELCSRIILWKYYIKKAVDFLLRKLLTLSESL